MADLSFLLIQISQITGISFGILFAGNVTSIVFYQFVHNKKGIEMTVSHTMPSCLVLLLFCDNPGSQC